MLDSDRPCFLQGYHNCHNLEVLDICQWQIEQDVEVDQRQRPEVDEATADTCEKVDTVAEADEQLVGRELVVRSKEHARRNLGSSNRGSNEMLPPSC